VREEVYSGDAPTIGPAQLRCKPLQVIRRFGFRLRRPKTRPRVRIAPPNSRAARSPLPGTHLATIVVREKLATSGLENKAPFKAADDCATGPRGQRGATQETAKTWATLALKPALLDSDTPKVPQFRAAAGPF
jgi:hypothetical protein